MEMRPQTYLEAVAEAGIGKVATLTKVHTYDGASTSESEVREAQGPQAIGGMVRIRTWAPWHVHLQMLSTRRESLAYAAQRFAAIFFTCESALAR